MFKKETLAEYESIRNKIAEHLRVTHYTTRDGITELMDNYITGNDYYIDEKDDTYVRMVRNTFSRSLKTRYLIVVEIKKIDDSNYSIFVYHSTHWKFSKGGGYKRFTINDKPKRLVRYL